MSPRHEHAAQRARHDPAAAAQLHGLVQARDTQHPHDQQGTESDLPRIRPRVLQRAQAVVVTAPGEKGEQHEIERQRDGEQRDDEREDQPARLTPRGCLA